MRQSSDHATLRLAKCRLLKGRTCTTSPFPTGFAVSHHFAKHRLRAAYLRRNLRFGLARFLLYVAVRLVSIDKKRAVSKNLTPLFFCQKSTSKRLPDLSQAVAICPSGFRTYPKPAKHPSTAPGQTVETCKIPASRRRPM